MLKALKIKFIKKWRRIQALQDIEDNLNHKTAASIFRLALREPSVELLLRPVENRRIIKLEERGMYITLDKSILEIYNHSFSYHLEIGYDKFLKLSRLFDIKLDALMEKEEENISHQVHSGLNKVLETFKTK